MTLTNRHFNLNLTSRLQFDVSNHQLQLQVPCSFDSTKEFHCHTLLTFTAFWHDPSPMHRFLFVIVKLQRFQDLTLSYYALKIFYFPSHLDHHQHAQGLNCVESISRFQIKSDMHWCRFLLKKVLQSEKQVFPNLTVNSLISRLL